MKHDAGRTHRQKRELKESQLSEIRDSFDLFDQDGLGTIRATDLVTLRPAPRTARHAAQACQAWPAVVWEAHARRARPTALRAASRS